jgi:hypothetical protein
MPTKVSSILIRLAGIHFRLLAVATCLEVCLKDDDLVGQGVMEILEDITDDLETLETSVREISEVPGNGKVVMFPGVPSFQEVA